MNTVNDVHQLKCGSASVWLDNNGESIWIKTNDPYDTAIEIENVQAAQMAEILISLVRSRRGDPVAPPGPSCITEADLGYGPYYNLPDDKIVFWDRNGGPVFVQTKYPNNVPIQLTLQEALEFGEKLIEITRESIRAERERIRNELLAQENPEE